MKSIKIRNIGKRLLLFLLIIELAYISYLLIPIVEAWGSYGRWNSPPYPNLSYANTCDGVEYDAVNTALGDWESIDATNPPNFYEYDPDNPNEPHISIWDPYEGGVNWDGRCTAYLSNGYIIFAEIEINEYYTSSPSYDFNAVRSVAGHEIGHALGLTDQPIDAKVLMNENTGYRCFEYGIYKPTDDEVDAINSLYP